MSFWWMKPGWKSAECSCGANIWDDGGDPDWGQCYSCLTKEIEAEKATNEEYNAYMEAEYEAFIQKEKAKQEEG